MRRLCWFLPISIISVAESLTNSNRNGGVPGISTLPAHAEKCHSFFYMGKVAKTALTLPCPDPNIASALKAWINSDRILAYALSGMLRGSCHV